MLCTNALRIASVNVHEVLLTTVLAGTIGGIVTWSINTSWLISWMLIMLLLLSLFAEEGVLLSHIGGKSINIALWSLKYD